MMPGQDPVLAGVFAGTNTGNQQLNNTLSPAQPAVLGATTQAPQQAAPSGGGGYAAPAANQQKIDAINANYDNNKNWYSGLLGNIDPQKQADMNNTNQYYGDQLTGLTHQRDAAFQNLDTQTNLANQSYTKGLDQLGNQIRNQYQGQLNQQGTQGAGDSSATGMLGYALGQDQNLQRTYMNQDLNNQMTQIGHTRDNDTTQFQDQSNQVNDLKQQQYTAIAKQYQALTDQINTQLFNNEAARRSALQYAGQWAASQASGVDQSIANALGAAKTNVNNLPTVAQTPMASYTAHNVVAPTVAVQSDLQRPVDNTPLQQIYNPYRQQQQQQY